MLELDSQVLQKYYDAIHLIRLALCGEEISLGFKDWPTPNQFYRRTPYYMYLEINDKHLDRLWTPFGEVKLLGSGLYSELKSITEEFLYKMMNNWEIEDVTAKVMVSNYDEEEKKEYNSHKGYESSYYKNATIYLIKKVGNIVLAESKPKELKLYSGFGTKNYERDTRLFKKVSNGKETF